jgi:hypothetical protein
MKAIRTQYFGPGNVRGSRIMATDEDGNRIYVPYESELSSDGAHDKAALALCAKMGWTGNLYRGGLKRGNVYVFGPGQSATAQVIE